MVPSLWGATPTAPGALAAAAMLPRSNLQPCPSGSERKSRRCEGQVGGRGAQDGGAAALGPAAGGAAEADVSDSSSPQAGLHASRILEDWDTQERAEVGRRETLETQDGPVMQKGKAKGKGKANKALWGRARSALARAKEAPPPPPAAAAPSPRVRSAETEKTERLVQELEEERRRLLAADEANAAGVGAQPQRSSPESPRRAGKKLWQLARERSAKMKYEQQSQVGSLQATEPRGSVDSLADGSQPSSPGGSPTAAKEAGGRRLSFAMGVRLSAKAAGWRNKAAIKLGRTLAPFLPNLVVEKAAADVKTTEDYTSSVPVTQPTMKALLCAVLIVDVSGFTALTEELSRRADGVEILTTSLNAYFERMIRMVHWYDGDVLRFAGDSMICLFAARKSDECPTDAAALTQAASRALCCAANLTAVYGNMMAAADGTVLPCPSSNLLGVIDRTAASSLKEQLSSVVLSQVEPHESSFTRSLTESIDTLSGSVKSSPLISPVKAFGSAGQPVPRTAGPRRMWTRLRTRFQAVNAFKSAGRARHAQDPTAAEAGPVEMQGLVAAGVEGKSPPVAGPVTESFEGGSFADLPPIRTKLQDTANDNSAAVGAEGTGAADARQEQQSPPQEARSQGSSASSWAVIRLLMGLAAKIKRRRKGRAPAAEATATAAASVTPTAQAQAAPRSFMLSIKSMLGVGTAAYFVAGGVTGQHWDVAVSDCPIQDPTLGISSGPFAQIKDADADASKGDVVMSPAFGSLVVGKCLAEELYSGTLRLKTLLVDPHEYRNKSTLGASEAGDLSVLASQLPSALPSAIPSAFGSAAASRRSSLPNAAVAAGRSTSLSRLAASGFSSQSMARRGSLPSKLSFASVAPLVGPAVTRDDIARSQSASRIVLSDTGAAARRGSMASEASGAAAGRRASIASFVSQSVSDMTASSSSSSDRGLPAVEALGTVKLQARCTDVMRRFVPEIIAKRIEARTMDYLNEPRVATCLFIGLSSLNGIVDGSSAPPEGSTVPGAVQDSVTAVMEALRDHEGTTLQLRTDEKGWLMIAAFGLPGHTHTDDPIRGVLAALAAIKTMKERGLTARIGVTTGKLLCAVVGGAGRVEYTLFGDAINLAARLMVRGAKDGDVVVDATTMSLAKRRVQFDDLGPMRFKGKKEAVTPYRALPPRARAVQATRRELLTKAAMGEDVPVERLERFNSQLSNVQKSMPLAGRNQSLAVIDALLQGLGETSGGTRGAALLVNADEGMGKTALVNEVENRTILLSEQTPDAPDALHALVTVRTKGHANRAWQSLLPMRGVVKQLISKYSESLGEPVAGGAVVWGALRHVPEWNNWRAVLADALGLPVLAIPLAPGMAASKLRVALAAATAAAKFKQLASKNKSATPATPGSAKTAALGAFRMLAASVKSAKGDASGAARSIYGDASAANGHATGDPNGGAAGETADTAPPPGPPLSRQVQSLPSTAAGGQASPEQATRPVSSISLSFTGGSRPNLGAQLPERKQSRSRDDSDAQTSRRSVSSELRAERVQELLVNLIATAARTRPLLLLVEDLHNMDASSLRCLVDVVALAAKVPLVVIMTSRPTHDRRSASSVATSATHSAFDELWLHPRVQRLNLDALDAVSLAVLVQHHLGEALCTDGAISKAVWERTRGHPLHAVQMLAFLFLKIEAERTADDELSSKQLAEYVRTSCSVQNVLTDRIDRLRPGPQLTAKAASVLGEGGFEVRLLQTIHPMALSEEMLRSDLRELKSMGIIFAEEQAGGDDTFAFVSEAIRQVAYELIPLTRRRALHFSAAHFMDGERRTRNLSTFEAGEGAEARKGATAPAFAIAAHYEASFSPQGGEEAGMAFSRTLALLEEEAARASASQERLELYERMLRLATQLPNEGSDELHALGGEALLQLELRADRLRAWRLAMGGACAELARYAEAVEHHCEALRLGGVPMASAHALHAAATRLRLRRALACGCARGLQCAPRATVEAARGLVSAAAHHTAALPLALALRRYAAAYFADGEAIFDQLDVASATEAKTPV